jgi:hypothetical protein
MITPRPVRAKTGADQEEATVHTVAYYSIKGTKYFCKIIPIKNYLTKVQAPSNTVDIQDERVKYGTYEMLYKYEKDHGHIAALQLLLRIENQCVSFSPLVHWRRFQRVWELHQVRRFDEEEYVYCVAGSNVRDEVMAQLALYETEIVDMPQVFLPFATV